MERWERLLDELREELLLREDELQLLHDIDIQLLKSDRPLKTTFDYIVKRTQQLLQSDCTFILLRRGRRLEAAYSADREHIGQRIDMGVSLTGEALLMAKTLNVNDVTAAPYADKYVPIRGYNGPPLRSLLATPITVRETKVGVLCAESARPRAFKAVHERIIAAIAAQVGIALDRVQVFDQNKLFSQVDALMFAPEASHQVISAALQKVMDALHELEHIELTDAHILFRQDGNRLEIVHSTSPSEVGLVVEVGGSVSGRAIREMRTVVVGDVSSDPEYRQLFAKSAGSEIAIPILLGNSDVAIGVLNVESDQLDAFEGFSQVLLERFADKVRTLLAFAKLRSDVTESMEVRNANDLLVAVGDQASNMIHRMNNTIGAMRLRIIELQDLQESDKPIDNEFLTESLATLRRLADQTLQLPEEVRRLLNQQGVAVDVSDVVQVVLGKFEVPDNVTLKIDLDPDLPSLSLYSFDIVVENLIQNAIDAMPGGGTLTLSTMLTYDEEVGSGYVELAVENTGAGIAKEILPRIFDLNFTTKDSKGKGHGLGLWWIRNFVLRARGDISVLSMLGQGTRFTVKMPVSRS